MDAWIKTFRRLLETITDRQAKNKAAPDTFKSQLRMKRPFHTSWVPTTVVVASYRNNFYGR
jgi:hypothetical protein